MGRAGSGGGGGRSSSGHSSSRSSHSSSGHRVSSGGISHRAGSGSSYRPTSSYHSSPSYRPSRPSYSYGYNRPVAYHSSPMSARGTVTCVIIVLVLCFAYFMMQNWGGTNKTVEMTGLGREKLNASIQWTSGCIVDEIDYIDNRNATASGLKEFYDKTGMQPYIVFKAIDPSLKTDDQKQAYADNWYRENIHNEATILYMYFDEVDQSHPGYMTLIGGSQTRALFDNLAQDKFWEFIDMYWAMDESVMTTDKLIVQSFVNTGKYLIDKGKITVSEKSGFMGILSTVFPIVIGGVVLVIILVVIFKILKWRRAQRAAENAETAAILNAPLDTSDHSADDLVNKYK